MRKRCPRCGGEEFIVSAHVVQEWLVDECGLCLKVIDDCVAITHEADDTDIWQCKKCGIDAPGKHFNVEE